MIMSARTHRRIYASDDVVDYAFMGTEPNSPDNRWLLDATQQQIPVIHFLGNVAGSLSAHHPDIYCPVHPERLRVQLVGASAQALPPDPPERRYALP
jgi:putative restriction endonuclease